MAENRVSILAEERVREFYRHSGIMASNFEALPMSLLMVEMDEDVRNATNIPRGTRVVDHESWRSSIFSTAIIDSNS